MSARRSRKHYAPAPVVLPGEQQKIQRLPMFGPGLVIVIPLHLWPIYQQANRLDVLPRNHQLTNDERLKQQVVYVKSAFGKPEPDLWQCLVCAGQPELRQPEMVKHMQQVHQLDTKTMTGTKTLTAQLDAGGEYQSTFEYDIQGMKFLRYQRKNRER